MENKIFLWEKEENKTFAKLPISLYKTEKNKIVAATNSDTEELLGHNISGIAQGNTEEEAINKLFKMILIKQKYLEEIESRYYLHSPFIKGSWDRPGSYWFFIFGISFTFRYSENMKHGWYVPFTKLNISINNHWKNNNK